MSRREHNEFGGIDKDVEGEVETRKVQTGGRLNLPDKFLEYIDSPQGSKVMVFAEDGELKIKKADAEHLAVAGVLEGISVFNEVTGDGE